MFKRLFIMALLPLVLLAGVRLVPGGMPGEQDPRALKLYHYGDPDIEITPESDFGFNAASGTITGYTGTNPDVVIPWEIGGVPVVAIGDSVFEFDQRVTKITSPRTLTSIGYAAFAYSSLTTLTAPALTSIGDNAFYYCSTLTSVYYGSEKPMEGEGIYNGTPTNLVNYVTNPQATGWGATFGGRPVVRSPLYGSEVEADYVFVNNTLKFKGQEVAFGSEIIVDQREGYGHCATIQEALDIAASIRNDETHPLYNAYIKIKVAHGAYNEDLTINVNRLLIMGENRRSIINGSVVVTADVVFFAGLSFRYCVGQLDPCLTFQDLQNGYLLPLHDCEFENYQTAVDQELVCLEIKDCPSSFKLMVDNCYMYTKNFGNSPTSKSIVARANSGTFIFFNNRLKTSSVGDGLEYIFWLTGTSALEVERCDASVLHDPITRIYMTDSVRYLEWHDTSIFNQQDVNAFVTFEGRTLPGNPIIYGQKELGSLKVHGDLQTESLTLNGETITNFLDKTELPNVPDITAQYSAWTTNVVSSGTNVITSAWGNQPRLELTDAGVIDFDLGTASNGLHRLTLSLWSGTNSVSWITNNVDFAETPDLETDAYNTILIRKIGSAKAEGRQL